MNAGGRHELDQEPVPTFEGQLARAGVGLTPSGWRVYWLVGTEKRWVGEPYSTPREAARASAYLNARSQA
jgi:hypothetical protein